jgi:predicted nucleic acid-binding protein
MLIADTGFILARWSKSSARRRWAHAYLEEADLPFVTAEAALMEAGFRLDVPELAPRLLADGDYLAKLSITEHAEDLLWLLRKYADQKMDLVDACIVKLFELNPEATVLTTDRGDFSVYRTRSGTRIRCDFGPD